MVRVEGQSNNYFLKKNSGTCDIIECKWPLRSASTTPLHLYIKESKESLEFEHANNESFHLFDFLCEIRQGRDAWEDEARPQKRCFSSSGRQRGDDGEIFATHEVNQASFHCSAARDVSSRIRARARGIAEDPIRC